MTRRRPSRDLHEKIAVLQSSTRERQRRNQIIRFIVYGGSGVIVFLLLGIVVNRGMDAAMNRVLFNNPRYALQQIVIEPRELFSPHQIREAAGVDFGDNLWRLDLPKITHDIETLPYVANAHIERHFPNTVIIRIRERVPIVKLLGVNAEAGTRELFYLDHDLKVLKPRQNETLPPLPEITGMNAAELEPGQTDDDPRLQNALAILDHIGHSTLPLHGSLEVRTIDISKPLMIRVVTTHDAIVIFRPDYIDQQLTRLQQIMDKAESNQKTIRTVDLSLDRNVPVTFFE